MPRGGRRVKTLIGSERVFDGKTYRLVLVTSVKHSAESRADNARKLEGKSARVIKPTKNFRAYVVYVEGK